MDRTSHATYWAASSPWTRLARATTPAPTPTATTPEENSPPTPSPQETPRPTPGLTNPIGNRKQAWISRDYVSKTYHTNNLNQYTEITDNTRPSFTPAHDQEGNQTLVRTNTGDWQVTYNADNRPVTFTKGSLRIENKYDCRGRHVEKATYRNNQLQKRLRFLYNGCLQIAAVEATNTTVSIIFISSAFSTV